MDPQADTPIRRELLIGGHVQGVFFRDSTRRVAQTEGVTGWARNRPDGNVEVVLEGPAHAVEAVIDFCRRGPAHARVDFFGVTERAPEGLSGFSIS